MPLPFSPPPAAASALELVLIGAAAALAVVLLMMWLRERHAGRARAARRSDEVDRELGAVAQLSASLADARDADHAARLLVDAVFTSIGVDFAAVALVDEQARRARGLVARGRPEVEEWWPSMRVHLDSEPSAIAATVQARAPLPVDDVAASPIVNPRLAEQVGAKSAAFVPVLAAGAVEAVLVVAREQVRPVAAEELALLAALAAETALALGRVHTATALEEALARERLVASIGRRVRSELDLDAVLRVAVEELGRAVGVSRAFIRLGETGEAMPVLAEWDAPDAPAVGDEASRLPALNLALRERRTVRVSDIETAKEIHDPALGDVDLLRRLGTRAVLATPIVVFDRVIGVFGLHRPRPGAWSEEEVALAEAVAREAGLAIHTARLLEDDRRRVEQQAGLLEAAAVVTSELRLEPVLDRLVRELVKLLRADAADLFIDDPARGGLRCVAEHGLGSEVIGWQLDRESGLSSKALELGRTVRSAEYERLERPVTHPAYAGFNAAMAAPLVWSGATRGVIGVGSRSPTREFVEADAQVLETFAGLASLALANAETYERSERQARIERGFYRIASLLGEPVSPAAAYGALAHAACEAFAAAFGAVLMPGADGLELAGRHELGEAEAAELEPPLSGVQALADAVRVGRVLASSKLLEDERFPEAFRELAAAAGYRSLLVTPFQLPRRHDRGGVLVMFREVRELSDDDLVLAQHLGGAARGALERSELFERERTSRALAQQLARTGGLLATELDPAAVLEELAGQAPGLLGADAAAIHVLRGDELVAAAVAGEGTESARGAHSPVAGAPAGDVIQARSPVAIPDAEQAGVVANDDAVLATGRRAFLGVPLYAAEGDLRGTLAVYAREPREWRDEEVEALVALAGNAAAVLANAELYQQVALEKERLDAILGNVADGIVAVDPDGVIVLWNRAAERVTGVPQAEALGRPLVRVLQRDLASGDGGDRLVQVQRGGEQVWLSVSEAVMRDPAGEVAGRIFAFRDVSAERIVEQMKTTFVSTVSQELRRPLTSIYGFSETLLRRDVLFSEEERQTFLGYIASEAERLTSIVDQLLSVARLDAGDLEVELAPIDVRDVVAQAVEPLASSGSVNGHRFVLDLPNEPLDASVDRERLRQILDALVENAVKYSPEGGTVTLAARRRPDAVEVRVTDEGIGIAPDEHDRIFSKFYRSDSTGGGTGLGLFIVQGLVRAMGGRIWVDSDAGAGASFVFELPVARGRSNA